MNKEVTVRATSLLHFRYKNRVYYYIRNHTKHIRYKFVSFMRSESAISVHVIHAASSFPVFKPYTDYNKILSL